MSAKKTSAIAKGKKFAKTPAAKTVKKKSSETLSDAPSLNFPSVQTRRPQLPSDAIYDSLGLPFAPSRGDGVFNLQDFFGAKAITSIQNSGQIIFHSMGDSGVHSSAQEDVAEAMSRDIDDAQHEQGPSFLLHLGDVIYSPNKEAGYIDRFYRMYDHYNRLIFAVPGNHDGEVFSQTDPVTLAAFIENFCAPPGSQPPLAKKYGVLMPNQPGPYWHLQAPFLDIIGLYSNEDENSGVIANAKVGTEQKTWLEVRLKGIAADRAKGKRHALVIAVHHPPYARGFHETGYGHPGNPEMLADIDACCTAANILPDAVLAGHTHSFQLYVRSQSMLGKAWQIPYFIVGTGGIGLQKIPAPTGVKNAAGDVEFVAALKDYGYLTVTASSTRLVLVFTAVENTHREVRRQVTVDLTSHQLV